MYRRFTTSVDPKHFVITEREPTDRHPMNWGLEEGSDFYGRILFPTSREGAWDRAREQELPVLVVLLSGEIKSLGVVFDCDVFERACYRGYVSYGYSMSDGYYAPIRFESWVQTFRADPEGTLRHGNDAWNSCKDLLPLYESERS